MTLDQPGSANSEANSIRLFRMDGEEYRSVYLVLEDDGGLQLSAYDMGPTVERIWGHDDYEFWVEIKPHAMRRLAFALLLTDTQVENVLSTNFEKFASRMRLSTSLTVGFSQLLRRTICG